MFKYVAFIALFALASAVPKAKPEVFAAAPLAYTADYTAPLAYSAPLLNAAYASPYAYAAGYHAAPLAYSHAYPAYDDAIVY